MNLYTSLHPGNGSRSGHDPRPPRGNESSDRGPVAPVAFLEPDPLRTTPDPQGRRADQDEETLRPFSAPFEADELGDR